MYGNNFSCLDIINQSIISYIISWLSFDYYYNFNTVYTVIFNELSDQKISKNVKFAWNIAIDFHWYIDHHFFDLLSKWHYLAYEIHILYVSTQHFP